MPPRAKFTKEEVIDAALSILRESGREGVTARALGAKLGSSARPVFTLFSGMDEILSETERAARIVYGGYIAAGLGERSFKGVGMGYLRFAQAEPKLFQYLFLSERKGTTLSILPEIDDNYGAILDSVRQTYGFDTEQSQRLYLNMWIYTHGIATLVASRACHFTEEEMSGMLDEVCRALIIKMKGEEK